MENALSASDKYREISRRLLAQAEAAKDEQTRLSYEKQAAELVRQADEVERNPGLTIDVELPREEEGKTKH